MGEVVPIRSGNGASEGLTRIPAGMHCAATSDGEHLDGHDELDQIDVDNFLSTLAEVAITVARREQQWEP